MLPLALALTVIIAGSVGPRRLDISYPTTEFNKLVKMWDQFDEETMGIFVRHIKRCNPFISIFLVLTNSISSALPDYVFDAGERPPKQAQKRTKGHGKTGGDAASDLPNKKIRTLVFFPTAFPLLFPFLAPHTLVFVGLTLFSSGR